MKFFAPVFQSRAFSLGEFLLLEVGAAFLIVGCSARLAGRKFIAKSWRLNLRSYCCSCCRVFQLRTLLTTHAAGAGLSWRPRALAKGA